MNEQVRTKKKLSTQNNFICSTHAFLFFFSNHGLTATLSVKHCILLYYYMLRLYINHTFYKCLNSVRQKSSELLFGGMLELIHRANQFTGQCPQSCLQPLSRAP